MAINISLKLQQLTNIQNPKSVTNLISMETITLDFLYREKEQKKSWIYLTKHFHFVNALIRNFQKVRNVFLQKLRDALLPA